VTRATAVFLLAAWFLHSHSATANCEVATAPVISVALAASGPVMDRSHSIADLSRFPATRSKGTESYDHALGLTETAINSENDYEISFTGNNASGYCSTVFAANLKIIWKTRVYLAAQIPPRSCTYKITSAHEQKHVAVDRAMRKKIAAWMRKALATVTRRGYSAPTQAESQALLRKTMSAVTKKALDAFEADLAARQLKIDTPEEYDRLGRICGDAEVQRILRG
jgi:hypothetical protein